MKVIIIIFIFIFLFYINIINKKEFFKNDSKVSALIISYNRPHNLDKLVSGLLKFKEINDIVILHGHKDFKKEIIHPKVKNIDDFDDNNKYFTLRRFKNVNYCRNNAILLLDDDLLPSHKLLSKMLFNYHNDPDNIYGPFSRYCKENYIFNPKNNYNFIILGLSLTSKNVINKVWKIMNTSKYKNLLDLVIKQKGNCEDLLFNHIFIKTYNKKPLFVKGDYKLLDTSNGFSTIKPKNHSMIRKNFCKLISQ